MDRLRLIGEIYKRPVLWNYQSREKSRVDMTEMWKEVAACMERDAEECKRGWKNLRDAYRAELRRIDIRIQKDMLRGTYDRENEYSSSWVFFEHMQFIKDIKKPRRDYNQEFLEFYYSDHFKKETCAEGDTNDCETYELKTNNFTMDNIVPSDVKCPEHSYDQIRFLDDHEREEQNLMKSTSLDISRTNHLGHVGDSDYNFLVSFIPQLKKMNELQNLQFRAKMTEFVFTMMAQCKTNNITSVL